MKQLSTNILYRNYFFTKYIYKFQESGYISDSLLNAPWAKKLPTKIGVSKMLHCARKNLI